jgi:alkyl hydroperoxide reductase subunit F
MNERPAYDVLVVGGGPAGSTAAIYAARKGIRTALVAERMGGQVLDTAGIENFTSLVHIEGPQLGAALEQHVKEYNVDLLSGLRASSVIVPQQPGELIEVTFQNGARLTSRSVVLALGACWRDLGVPGENEYRNRGVTYCPHCDGPLFAGKPVAVIGGGNSGIEAAIDLAGIVEHVTVIEFDPNLRADEVLQNKLKSLSNVTVITHAQTAEISGDGTSVTSLSYIDRSTDEVHQIAVRGVFVQIGLVPNTAWLEGVVEVNERGEILVDSAGRTNVSGIYAAGDCTTVPFKQIIIAAGEGAKAALGAFDYLIRTPVTVS